jgi:hypothetical protein
MTSNNMTPEQAARLSLAEQHEWFRRATSRRALLRGGLVGAGALAAGPSLMSATASASTHANSASLVAKADYVNGATVVPFGRHLIFGADPTTQIAVSWQVPTLVTNPFVRVGTSPLDLSERIPAQLKTVSTPRADISAVDSVSPHAPSTIEQHYLHVTISHLMPGKTYYYSVGHDHWDPQGGDLLTNVRSFTTAPSGRGAFTFTAFGDQGVSYDAVGTANLVRAQKPAFHLHAGDISYAESGGGGLVTDSYDPQVWDSFLTQVEPVASEVPWQVAVGNHEMEPWYSPDGYGGQFGRFAFPTSASYYSFTYGNVAVLSLDANDVSYEIPANLGYSGGAQVAWLGKQLAAFRKRPDIDFIVAYFHHCAYCTATAHSSDGGVRQYFVPLFDTYDVDLVITGHNHVYERTDPLRGGAVTGSAPIGATVTPATQGTTYITAGGAGDSLYQFTAADSYEGSVDDVSNISAYVNESGKTHVSETINWSRVRYTGYSLIRVDSTPARSGGTSTLAIHSLAEDGTEIDALTLARTAK